MEVVRNVQDLRRARANLDGPVGFVPTMGALHDGHASLLAAARSAASSVILSIFVNPLQFGPNEDLDLYPRTEDADLEIAEQQNVDLVFIPTEQEMYPPGSATRISVGAIGDLLEGAARPGHFDGVATVVARLFNLTQPDVALFGQKDAQQVAVIKQMTSDLGWSLEVAVCPTARASDGLALSSRNAYLSPSERSDATALWAALQAGRDTFREGAEAAEVEKVMLERLTVTDSVQVQYAKAVHPRTFEGWESGPEALLVIAAKVGETRLIDNLPVYRDQ